MYRQRIIKPKIDKYIQLYSKKARTEDGAQTIALTSAVVLAGGLDYGPSQAATITAPISGTQPTVSLTQNAAGTITGATLANFATAVYNNPPSIILTQTLTTSVKSIEIVNGGSGFITAPKLKIEYPPTVRQAILTGTWKNQSAGSINTITISDGGAGYGTTVPAIKVYPVSGTQETDFPAQLTAVLTNGSITSVTIVNAGTYDWADKSQPPIIEVAPPTSTDQAKATCTIDSTGSINSITITQQGSNYIQEPAITVENDITADLRAYLVKGFGANLDLNYQYVPTTYYKYSWDLENPIILNENGVIQVVHREFYNIPANDKGKIIMTRLHDIAPLSTINTKNTGINTDFNGGVVIDTCREDYRLNNNIALEVYPQTIDRISLSLNHGIADFLGFHAQIDFMILLKISEKEPQMLEFGTLNNINFNQQ